MVVPSPVTTIVCNPTAEAARVDPKDEAPLYKPTLQLADACLGAIAAIVVVPDSAAVNESVLLAVYAKKTSAKGFINAILRNFIRDKKEIVLPDKNKNELFAVSLVQV